MQITDMGKISDLYETTNYTDALPNLYEVVFPIVPSYPLQTANELGFEFQKIRFRATTFTLPSDVSNMEDIPIKGTILSRAIGTINTSNEISVDIIVDGDWKAYKVFRAWKGATGSATTRFRKIKFGPVAGGSTSNRGQMVISTPLTSRLGNIKWTFHEVQLFSIGEIAFNYEGGTPIILNLTFKFAYYEVT